MSMPNLGGFGSPTNLAQTPRHGATYDFDFDAGEFVTGPDGKVAVLNDVPSLRQSLEKLLRTDRYVFLAYDHDYGSDLRRVTTGPTPIGNERTALMTMWATESLLSDPRVTRVSNLALTQMYTPDRLRVVADVTDTFGVVIALDVTIPLT